jgi:dTDP-4-amino-4,6-dideoxygalactose transaminase
MTADPASASRVSVPFVDLSRPHEALRSELTDAFERVVDASAFILGREVEAFEKEFASFTGARHCVGVASGTAALTLALRAAGVGAGDEVVVPAHTFVASALAVMHAGATPVFCDVHPATGLIDSHAARGAVTPRTAAIVAVHLHGQCCDMDALGELAESHGLFLLEDAAQAQGATFAGRPAGSLGSAAGFSFYPSKNLGALGDGGAVCTDDDALADKVRRLRHLGQLGKGDHLEAGYNERLDGLQAAFLRVKLPHVDGWNEQRRAHAAHYRDGLAALPLELLAEDPRSPCVFHLFPARMDSRDEFASRLEDLGIGVGIHYSPACHRQPALRQQHPGEFPVADAWAAREVSLPMFAELEAHEVDAVIHACGVALAS